MNAIVARYDADASDYARYWGPVLERTSRRLVSFVDDFVARRDGRLRVLEVGAGTGTLSLAVLERWPQAELTVSDAARGMLDLAQQRISASNLANDKVRFVVGGADSLPLEGGAFDLVISSFVLQLVPDRLDALREAHRLLSPNGMVAYLTWLDRDSRVPFVPAEEFDEAVLDLQIEEPELEDEPHAGDVRSGRSATGELRRAGFVNASAREDELVYHWTHESYLEYKLAYDERALISMLDGDQRSALEANARKRLDGLSATDFSWQAPVVSARALRPG